MNCCDDFGKCRGGFGCPVADEPLRTPRTLVEAFGPGSKLEPVDRKMTLPEIGDFLVLVMVVISFVSAVLMACVAALGLL